MILFINACVRAGSRTKRIADAYLTKVAEPVMEVKLEDIDFPVTNEEFLKKRDSLIAAGQFSDC